MSDKLNNASSPISN